MNNLIRTIGKLDLTPLPQVNTNSSTPLETVLTIVFTVMGSVALIVIIVSGIQLTLSQGDPQGVNKARNTIIYAAIGLAVAVSAGSILSFVVRRL